MCASCGVFVGLFCGVLQGMEPPRRRVMLRCALLPWLMAVVMLLLQPLTGCEAARAMVLEDEQ